MFILSNMMMTGMGPTGGDGNIPVLSYTTNLKVQLMAHAEAYANNDAMGTLTDQSGNGNNFTQAVAGNKGTYKTNILNSLAAYYFSDNARYYTSSYNLDDSKSASMFFVFKAEVDEVNIIAGTADSVLMLSGFPAKTTWRTWSNGSGNLYDATCTDNTGAFYYYSLIMSENTGANGTTNYRQSTTDKGTSGSRTRGVSTLLSAGDAFLGTQGFQGWLCELLVYEEAVSGGNLTTVESYLASKYGL